MVVTLARNFRPLHREALHTYSVCANHIVCHCEFSVLEGGSTKVTFVRIPFVAHGSDFEIEFENIKSKRGVRKKSLLKIDVKHEIQAASARSINRKIY